MDTDDEFSLDRNAFTTDVLSSMVPGDIENTHEVNNEVASDRFVDFHNDDTEGNSTFVYLRLRVCCLFVCLFVCLRVYYQTESLFISVLFPRC